MAKNEIAILDGSLQERDNWKVADDLMSAWMVGKSQQTMRNYKQDLLDFSRFMKLEISVAIAKLLGLTRGMANRLALRYKADMEQRKIWRSAQSKRSGDAPDRIGLAPSTINRRLAALRSVVALARRFGHIDWEIEVDPAPARAYRDTSGISRDDYMAVLRILAHEAENSEDSAAYAHAVRDQCIVRMLMDHALRRAELRMIDWPRDIDLTQRSIRIIGKGERQPTNMRLSKGSADAINAWLDVRGRDPGPLIQSLSNRALGQRISLRGLNSIIRSIGDRAGLSHITPHQFRHSSITRAIQLTRGDIARVRAFSRHAKPETVMIYYDNDKDVGGDIVDLVSDTDDDLA